MSDARYFHASLYSFNSAARSQVIARFNASMNDVAVRCWYDVEEDVFVLECPSKLGPNADAVLVSCIAKYIEEEIANAERDERTPNIQRFPLSAFNDALAYLADSGQDGFGDMPTEDPNSDALRSKKLTAVTFHVLNIEQASSLTALGAFRLAELPAELFERTLGSDAGMKYAMHVGLTLRALRNDHGAHVFNGRVGSGLPILTEDEEAAMLELALFQVVTRTSQDHLPAPEAKARTWKFVGDEPSVTQWLEGMGEIQYEPEEGHPMPKDTKKLLAADHQHQNPLSGRIRVPKGQSILPADSVNALEAKPKREATGFSTENKFSRLLQAKGRKGSESDETDETSEASDSDMEATKDRGNFASLLSRSGRPAPTASQNPTSSVSEKSDATILGQHRLLKDRASLTATAIGSQVMEVVAPARVSADASTSLPSVSRPSSSVQRGIRSDFGEHAQGDGFASHWSQFAAVDTVGLTADPAAQARWELEHNLRRMRARPGINSARSSQSLLSPPTSSSGSVVLRRDSVRNQRHLQTMHSNTSTPSLTASQATIRGYTETPPINGSWAGRIVLDSPSAEKLIDDSANDTSTNVKVPPGLKPEPEAVPSRPRLQEAVVIPQDDQCSEEDLIDLTDDGPSFAEYDGSRHITERLQSNADEPLLLHYTMRQQKKKNKQGGNGSKGNAAKVELEKPNPPPPPAKTQKIKAIENAKPNSSINSKAKPADISSGNMKLEPPIAQAEPKAIAEEAVVKSDLHTSIEKLLGVAAECEKSSVRADIGLILLKLSDDKAFRKKVFTSEILQTKLTGDLLSSTSFITRLTTSICDAQHTLGLVGGALKATTLYTFVVRDQDGQVHEIDMAAGATVSSCRSQRPVNVANLYMHYPFRVCDARLIVASTSDNEIAPPLVEEFLSTVQTIDMAPDFEVKIPPNAFTVEKVLAKREYTRAAEVGRLVVTEVQELFLESINTPEANLKATCWSRDLMIEAHRLWFEASVHFDDPSAIDAVGVQNVLDSLVTQMDGVGFGNKGPWQRPQEKVVVEAAIPFW